MSSGGVSFHLVFNGRNWRLCKFCNFFLCFFLFVVPNVSHKISVLSNVITHVVYGILISPNT